MFSVMIMLTDHNHQIHLFRSNDALDDHDQPIQNIFDIISKVQNVVQLMDQQVDIGSIVLACWDSQDETFSPFHEHAHQRQEPNNARTGDILASRLGSTIYLLQTLNPRPPSPSILVVHQCNVVNTHDMIEDCINFFIKPMFQECRV